MNLLQRATLGGIGGLDLSKKKIGNQAPIVESYRSGHPVIQPYSIINALEKDIKRNPFLYSALRKKADAIASVPFIVEEFRDGKWVRKRGHPAEHLIEGANPYMSGYELKKMLVYHKELVGTAYMQIVSVGGEPKFLQPLFPQFTRVVPSEENFIQGFEYRIRSQERREFKPREVFWTKHADPADPYKGLSPLEAISGEVQTDLEARKWNKISLANRGASDVAFILRDVMDEDDYQFARSMIEDRISGPENARRPWILAGDSEVRPMSYTAVEMDYINTRKFNREVISAALGVPAPLIGDADNSTYNNLDTLKKDFWQDTITNWLEELRQDLNRQILIPYYGDGRRSGAPTLRYMYDLSNVEALQSNIKEKAETARLMAKAGFSVKHINDYLEFDFDLTPEEEQAEPGPDQGADETAVRMARVAVSARSMPDVFSKAVREISKALGGSDPEQRIEKYMSVNLEGEDLARFIADTEGRACRQ